MILQILLPCVQMRRNQHGMDQHRASEQCGDGFWFPQKVEKVILEMRGRVGVHEKKNGFSSQMISQMIDAGLPDSPRIPSVNLFFLGIFVHPSNFSGRFLALRSVMAAVTYLRDRGFASAVVCRGTLLRSVGCGRGSKPESAGNKN